MTLTVHATSSTQDILPASSCHLLGLTGHFTSLLSTCHSYKLGCTLTALSCQLRILKTSHSSSCAGTLYMVYLFASESIFRLANDMGHAQDGAICDVVFCRAYRPIDCTWTRWHALLGMADTQVPLVSTSLLLCLAKMLSICIHQLFHIVLLFLVLH
jgi:hypothetical protein